MNGIRKKHCFLIGEKLGHSYSVPIHAFWNKYEYGLKPVPPEDVPGFLKSGTFDGLNVTIPYKELVMPYCADISPEARKIGSVNTIVKHADGTLHGYNTDYAGFLLMAEQAGICFHQKKILIFGSGGTSKTVRAAAGDAGAREIITVSRKGPVTYDMLEQHRNAEILINATPLGMYPNTEQMPFDPGNFPCCEGVIDVIYNPYRTRLIQRARELGIPCVSGLRMLVEQARKAGELFTGEPIDAALTEQIHARLERDTLNLVLIGMPGSGKSTAGRLLAEKMNRKIIDTDDVIAAESGMSVSDIFAKHGEAYFRALEQNVIQRYGKEKGMIIVTGGGAVLHPENIRNLAQNGKIVYLKRRLDALETGNGRPLSANKEALKQLAERRLPLYEKSCDFTADNNSNSPSDAADQILRQWNG